MLNKKVLVAAVIGGLFAGNAAATDFTAPTAAAYNASIGVFAKEIKTTATAATATQFDGVGVDVKWESGYAYSPGEVRYVRIEPAPHVKFQLLTVPPPMPCSRWMQLPSCSPSLIPTSRSRCTISRRRLRPAAPLV